MRFATVAQMRAAEEFTFRRLDMPSRVIMENAGRAVAAFVLTDCSDLRHVVVVAGSGNNGGDGYVAARALSSAGINVSVIALCAAELLKGDAAANAAAWENAGGRVIVFSPASRQDAFACLEDASVVIDALYGTGFHGALEGPAAEIAAAVNFVRHEHDADVVAVDVPSGIEADTGAVRGVAIEADATVTFQWPKAGELLFPAAMNVGELWVADVGICLPPSETPEQVLYDAEQASARLSPVLATPTDFHKGDKGHVLIAGGSSGHFGAPVLCARGALRTGAGLVTVALPGDAAAGAVSILPEAMTIPLESFSGVQELLPESITALKMFFSERLKGRSSAIAIGPGLGQGPAARGLLRVVLEYSRANKIGCVVDADALNLLAGDRSLRPLLGAHLVLTPHPGEMARLLEKPVPEVEADRIGSARAAAQIFGCWVVLKGARSVSAGPAGETVINPAADAVLATAGSGDVLCGIAAALLARGLSPAEALPAAVFVHGAAGVRLAAKTGGAIASDIADAVPAMLAEIAEYSPSEEGALPFFRRALAAPGSAVFEVADRGGGVSETIGG